jgi:hypothetical protein
VKVPFVTVSRLARFIVSRAWFGDPWPAMRVSASYAATACSVRAQLARESGVDPLSHICVWL